MSKHNRERRKLWKLGLHKKQIGRKLRQGNGKDDKGELAEIIAKRQGEGR